MSENPFEGIEAKNPVPAETAPAETAPAKQEAKSKKEAPRKASGFASRGKPISADDFPKRNAPSWAEEPNEYYEQLTDFSDLSQVNHRLNSLRARFYQINRQLKVAQRELARAKAEYSSQLRRELVNITGGTEKTRVAMAEIACEEWESDVVVYTQFVQEITNDQRIISKDLEILETLSNNIRAQIKIM